MSNLFNFTIGPTTLLYYMELWTDLRIHSHHFNDFYLLLSTHVLYHQSLQVDPSRVTLDQVAFQLLSEWAITQKAKCNCLSEIDMSSLILYTRLLSEHPIDMTCRHLLNTHAYTRQENKIPSIYELHAYEDSLHEINTNSDQYCLDHAVSKPLENTTKLEKKVAHKPCFCSICQEDIELKQTIYELPCGHCFHAHGADCLGDDCTILTWFQDHRTCPSCNIEVVL